MNEEYVSRLEISPSTSGGITLRMLFNSDEEYIEHLEDENSDLRNKVRGLEKKLKKTRRKYKEIKWMYDGLCR